MQLVGGRAKACEIYPDQFCEMLCKAAMEEKDAKVRCPKAAILLASLESLLPPTVHPRVVSGMPDVKSIDDKKPKQTQEIGLVVALNMLGLNDIKEVQDVTRELCQINEGPHDDDSYQAFDFHR